MNEINTGMEHVCEAVNDGFASLYKIMKLIDKGSQDLNEIIAEQGKYLKDGNER